VEDWEKHFADKSRRRFEKERAERHRQRQGRWLAAAVIATSIIAGIAGLAIFR
jgi:type IV secretory pathway component VirB8